MSYPHHTQGPPRPGGTYWLPQSTEPTGIPPHAMQPPTSYTMGSPPSTTAPRPMFVQRPGDSGSPYASPLQTSPPPPPPLLPSEGGHATGPPPRAPAPHSFYATTMTHAPPPEPGMPELAPQFHSGTYPSRRMSSPTPPPPPAPQPSQHLVPPSTGTTHQPPHVPMGPPPAQGKSWGPAPQAPRVVSQPQASSPPPPLDTLSVVDHHDKSYIASKSHHYHAVADPSIGPAPQPQTTQPQETGAAPPGRRGPRIDSSQMPRPLLDRGSDTLRKFHSRSQDLPPSSVSHFVCVDEGICSCRFMRATVNRVADSVDLQAASTIALGLVVQPLADLAPGEAPIQTVDHGLGGPIRCHQCRAYINAFVLFTDGGRRWVCNFCQTSNEVPHENFCPLDMNGRRKDIDDRPELCHGCVEFVAPAEYMVRPAQPPVYFVVLDVSYYANASGLVPAVVSTIRETLDQLILANPHTRFGIITYDRTLHFYNLKSHLSQPQMVVVSDLEESFLPFPECTTCICESRDIIDLLLERLPSMFAHNIVGETCLGAALLAACKAMTPAGGKLLVFQSNLPAVGPGAMRNRDDVRAYGTEKEKHLWAPQDPFYVKFADECAKNQICVDVFLCSPSYVDVATLSQMSRFTGGQLYYYPGFQGDRDQYKLHVELTRNLTRKTGFEAVMRVRCSKGLKVVDYLGNYTSRVATDVDLAAIDADKSIAVLIQHEDKLPEASTAYFQCALLYTTTSAERRLRVQTLALPVTSSMATMFRYSDVETVVNITIKQAVDRARTSGLPAIRDALVNSCVTLLHTYRKHCATTSSSGQLILPESLKLYPLYTLSLLKSPVFRGGNDVRADERLYLWGLLNWMSVHSTTTFVYPHLCALHSMAPEVGRPGSSVATVMPPMIPLTSEKVEPTGAYLVSNGLDMYMWLGNQVPRHFLMELLGIETLEGVDCARLILPERENDVSRRVNAVLQELRRPGPLWPNLRVVKQRDQLEARFFGLLSEDQLEGVMSYVDFLCHIHGQIMQRS